MTRQNLAVISHLKAKEHKPPAIWKLEIVLREVIKAVYGKTVVLRFETGKVGDNPFENMVHLHSSLNSGIQHHIEGILDRKFGPHFIVGYNGQMEGSFTAELDEAEHRIDERIAKRIESRRK